MSDPRTPRPTVGQGDSSSASSSASENDPSPPKDLREAINDLIDAPHKILEHWPDYDFWTRFANNAIKAIWDFTNKPPVLPGKDGAAWAVGLRDEARAMGEAIGLVVYWRNWMPTDDSPLAESRRQEAWNDVRNKIEEKASPLRNRLRDLDLVHGMEFREKRDRRQLVESALMRAKPGSDLVAKSSTNECRTTANGRVPLTTANLPHILWAIEQLRNAILSPQAALAELSPVIAKRLSSETASRLPSIRERAEAGDPSAFAFIIVQSGELLRIALQPEGYNTE
jgi:hypothetical protein